MVVSFIIFSSRFLMVLGDYTANPTLYVHGQCLIKTQHGVSGEQSKSGYSYTRYLIHGYEDEDDHEDY